MNTEKKVTKEMKEYAKDQMINLIRNISVNPVEVYSAKPWGGKKDFYLGKNFVDGIVERIKAIR